MHLVTTWDHQRLHPATPTYPRGLVSRGHWAISSSTPPFDSFAASSSSVVPRRGRQCIPCLLHRPTMMAGGPETYKGAFSVVDARGKRQFHSLSRKSSCGIGSRRRGSLFPYPALHGLELVGCHSMACGEVACEILFLSSARPSFSARRRRRQERKGGSVPAVILASISTLESAGIHDSGSSTRSWIGMLFSMVCC